jgi:recombination protein RecA
MANEKSKDIFAEVLNKDQERLLKQKLKALGIDEKCIKGGDIENVEFIPTGVFEVDSILGVGMGIPTGTLIEFCGESQSGKTWLGYKLIAEAQKQGKKCVFFNIENSYYPQRALSCGVNTSQLLLVENVGSAEKYGELLKFLTESGDYSIIVVDSISAMIPNDDLEKSLEQVQTIGIHAKFVKRLTKDLTAKTAATGTIVVLINQLYMGSGVMPGSMVKTASGGNAMNYFTHMRLWINKINGAAGQVTKKDAEGKDVIIGGKSKVLVMKTRYGQPGLTGEFKIMFTEDENTNPVDEFLYKAKAKGFEYIKEVRKKFSYVHPDTGEVLESKDSYEFVKMLMDSPAPEKRVRGDNSETVFEFLCGRLKVHGKPLNDLLEAIAKGPLLDVDEDDDDSGGISFDDAAKKMLT